MASSDSSLEIDVTDEKDKTYIPNESEIESDESENEHSGKFSEDRTNSKGKRRKPALIPASKIPKPVDKQRDKDENKNEDNPKPPEKDRGSTQTGVPVPRDESTIELHIDIGNKLNFCCIIDAICIYIFLRFVFIFKF